MKKVFYVIIGLIVLYFVLALFGPKTVRAERSITVNAPAEQVRARLGDYQYFHDRWSPWTALDPGMKHTFAGTPGEPGHQYTWSGNKEVGSGEMTLLRHSADSLVQRVAFTDQGDATTYYLINGEGQGTTHVTWGLKFDVGFLARTPMLFFNMDKMMGKDLENGLARFKQAVESESPAENVSSLNSGS